MCIYSRARILINIAYFDHHHKMAKKRGAQKRGRVGKGVGSHGGRAATATSPGLLPKPSWPLPPNSPTPPPAIPTSPPLPIRPISLRNVQYPQQGPP